MSDTVAILLINAVILPIVVVILKINREQSRRIGMLEQKLDNCLQKNSQAGTWQAGQERQRDMLIDQKLRKGDTRPLEP